MESCLPWCGALGGCLPAWCFLRLLLVPGTLQLAGGLAVIHTGPPIIVSLANTAVSFDCRINHQDIPDFKDDTVSSFHVDLHGRRSSKEQTICRQHGTENQTLYCTVKFSPPDASATGTYYCFVRRGDFSVQGNGTFVLVRDTGYQPPPPKPQEALLFSFTGLLSVLSVLGTAVLLWKKKRMSVLDKCNIRTCPDPKSTNKTTTPPAESIYTSLQRRETEIYACIEGQTDSPVSRHSPPCQEKQNRFQDDSEFNLVYENL